MLACLSNFLFTFASGSHGICWLRKNKRDERKTQTNKREEAELMVMVIIYIKKKKQGQADWIVARDCYYIQPSIVSLVTKWWENILSFQRSGKAGLAFIRSAIGQFVCATDVHVIQSCRWYLPRLTRSRNMYISGMPLVTNGTTSLSASHHAKFFNRNSIKTLSLEIIIWCNGFPFDVPGIIETPFAHKLSKQNIIAWSIFTCAK